MRRRLLTRPLITACLALLAIGNATAQGTSQGTDLEAQYFTSPTSGGVSRDQNVSIVVVNKGTTEINHFKVGVIKDGTLQFEEDVNQDVPINTPTPYPTVTLSHTLHFEYGDTSSVKAYVVADGDVDQSNDTVETTVEMLPLVDYPYAWNDETAQTDFHHGSLRMGWKWDNNRKAFYMSGRRTNWIGGLSTNVLNFKKGETVSCNFDYGTSGGNITLHATIESEDSTITQDIPLDPSTQDFSSGFFTFTPTGPSQVIISATLAGLWNASGSIYLRNINFSRAAHDLAVKAIKEPAADKIVISNQANPVTVTVSNVSAFDITNPKLSYKIGDKEVHEVYNGTIGKGESVDYTFKESFVHNSTANSTDTLAVWCNVDDDNNAANDTVKKALVFYKAVAFPYSTDFGPLDNVLWTAVDNNNDGATYTYGKLDDGTTLAYANAFNLDEELISPAIAMPEGTHRVSFYYSGRGNATSHLKLLAGQTDNVDSMKVVLFDQDVTNSGWIAGYHLLTNLPAGNWHFAFVLTGSNDGSYITHFKVDNGEDLCINSVKFDTESGFGLGNSKVTISYVNHGVTAQKDIKVKYYVNPAAVQNGIVTENEFTQSAEETVTQSVAPGDTIFYTFNKEVDLSARDSSYLLIGQITTKVGDDVQNDLIVGDQVNDWAAQTIPYYNGFDDQKRNQQWTYKSASESPWFIAGNYWGDYDANFGTLYHRHANNNSDPADDWAFSEAVQLQKGKYEVSFFYRGRAAFASPVYTQKFEAKLGNDRTPEAMTTELFRTDSADVYQPAWAKVIKVVDIPEDGQYYLGFHDFSNANSSETYIDAISIEPITEGLSLPYESDFANDSAAWTIYQAKTRNFPYWVVDGNSMKVERARGVSRIEYFEGLLVSPKLVVTPGKKVTIDVNYNLTSEQDSVKLNVYTASVNNPSEFTLIGQSGQDSTSATFTFVNTTDSVLFVGLRSNSDINVDDINHHGPFYTLSINSVKVSESVANGISSVSAGDQQKVVARYNLQGQRVDDSHRGVTIFKMSDGTAVKRIIR